MVPFVYLASVCRSLQCLISALTQAVEVVSCSGSLVQMCCGEGGALQTNVTGVCGEHWQCPATLGLPPLTAHVLSPSTLLRLRAALYGAGLALRAVPVFGFSTKARTRLCLHFVPSLSEQLRQPGA